MLTRPKACIKSIKFSDDTKLCLARHEILIFVGPNNAGKSAALREIFANIQTPNTPHVVIKSVVLGTEGSVEEAVNWADSLPRRSQIDPAAIELPAGRFDRVNFQNGWASGVSGTGFHSLVSLVATIVSAEGRIQISNQVQAINLYLETPAAPLHHLYASDSKEMQVSQLFQQAFGKELIVNRTAGAVIMLHMGTRPIPPVGQDRLSSEYRDALHQLPLVQNQGDGIRSFLGVLLHTLVVDRDIILIDEPEAFLHPPQANLLGRILATEVPNPRQLIVSTHSADFLRGALDAPNSRAVPSHMEA
jgi:ABC-type polar amino acid transport system ATPase subunit